MKTDLINTQWTCKITSVFCIATQDYRHHTRTVKPLGSNVGGLSYISVSIRISARGLSLSSA